MEKLTDKQIKALDFIRVRSEVDGMPPTLRELCEHMGYKAIGSAQDVISALRTKGYLEVPARRMARSFLLTQQGRSFKNKISNESLLDDFEDTISIPRLGSVPAGNAVESIENFTGKISVSLHTLPKPRPDPDLLFALQTQGDSMINAGILDGDWIIVKKQTAVDAGRIVVALVEGEATVKKLVNDPQYGWSLQPANPKYKPLYASKKSFKIIGQVIALQRTFT